MQIEFKKKFVKMLKKAPQKIQTSFYKRLELFQDDPYNPMLNNHFLTGKYSGCKSINISGNWRAIFQESQNKNLIIFLIIGTHPQLYK